MSRNLKLLIALIVAATIAAYVIIVIIPTTMAKRSYDAARIIGEDFRKAFQFTPEVKIEKTVVLNQQTPVWEMAVLSQNFEHRYTWTNSWLGSTKRIFITGTFDAKAGFDLHERFSITLKEDEAIITVPSPKLLSVESKGDIAYRDEQGVWNWVSINDRTAATNAFIKDAHTFAAQAPFVQDARKQMEERLKVFFQQHGRRVVLQYTEPIEPVPLR